MDTFTSPDPVAARSDRDHLIARLCRPSAVGAVVLAVLHALARYRTEDGASDLDLATTRFWAEPADRLLAPLLDWADPDIVYVSYGKLWLPVFLIFTAAAFLAHRERAPRGAERVVWWVTLVGYGGACLCVLGEYWTQWTADTNAVLDVVFLVSIPFLLVTVVGSTVLGLMLLVRKYRPRSTAVLLTLSLPGLVVLPMFLSLGSIVLPLAFGWAQAVRRPGLR